MREGDKMALTKKSSWLYILLSLFSTIFGIIINEIIDNWSTKNLELIDFTQQVLVSGLIIIVITIIIFHIVIGKKIDSKIELIRKEYILPLQNKFYCAFMQNQTERHKRMIECIKKAEKQIYILSDLAGAEEEKKKKHKEYLQTLNSVIKKKRGLKFLRIVVPHLDRQKSTHADDEIKRIVKENMAYEEHFRIINQCRDRSLLALRSGGPLGLSILLVDDQYLFLVIEKKYEEKLLANILEGGFFFEDLSKKLTQRFQECFEYLRSGTVIIE